ncbi:uncharacterized protein LOC144441134 [Glandiceps talaboti]
MMKTVLLLAFFTLSNYVYAQGGHLDFTICEEDMCECKAPNERAMDLLKEHDSFDCYCYCGYKEGDECSITAHGSDHCGVGTFCGLSEDSSKPAVCISRCKHPGVNCKLFSKCVISNDEPACELNSYDCTDEVVAPVCGEDFTPYINRCFFEQEKYNKWKDGLGEMKLLAHKSCEDHKALLDKTPSFITT